MTETTVYVDSAANAHTLIILLLGLIGMFVFLVYTVLKLVIFCRIFSKAGYCWAVGLLTLIPLVGLMLLLVLAFSQWPLQKELSLVKHWPSG